MLSSRPRSAQPQSWRPSLNQIALLLAAVVALALVAPAFAHAVDVWVGDEEFTYGFFIVPISMGLLWLRRDALREALSQGQGRGSALGLVPLAVSLLMLAFSARSGINVIGGLAVPPLLLGVALYLWGWPMVRVLAFPLLFLLFGLALYRGLLSSIGYTLQILTAHGAELTGRAVGLPVVRDGVTLTSDRFAFVVAETCSGMSSLLSLLALSALWMSFTLGRLPARLAVVASVLPLVMVANTIRVTLVLAVAWFFGEDAALGFFHGASSLVLFGAALAGLLLVSRLVGCRLALLPTAAAPTAAAAN